MDLGITCDKTDFWDKFKPCTTPEYRTKYAMAVDSYLEGKWEVAKEHLDVCVSVWPEDGPLKVYFYACMHASMYVCMRIYVCMHICVCVCVYVCMCVSGYHAGKRKSDVKAKTNSHV